LTADPDKPWVEYWHGKPITHRQLATLLGNFSIISETVRIGPETAKGYRCTALEDAFERYLNFQSDGYSHSDPSQRHNASSTGTSSTFRSVTQDQMLRIKNEDLSHGRSGCDAVTDETPKSPNAGHFQPRDEHLEKSLWDDLDIPDYLRRTPERTDTATTYRRPESERLGPPAISSGPDDDLGDFE
jgi:hypothetical protein